MQVDRRRFEGHEILDPGAVASGIGGYRYAFADVILLDEAANRIEVTGSAQVPRSFPTNGNRRPLVDRCRQRGCFVPSP